jgi:hypothetical protein
MNDHSVEPVTLFLSPDGNIYPDKLVCSGILPGELEGKPCPYSVGGRFPSPVPLDSEDPLYSIDKGKISDLCLPCAKQQLASLTNWQGHGGRYFPEELLPLRLFKCRMWLWLVVPGLYDTTPTQLRHITEE